MTRHFYRHKVTGIVAPLNDSFAAVFGDTFERVGAPAKDAPEDKTTKKAATKTDDTSDEAANPDSTTDAPKEGDK